MRWLEASTHASGSRRRLPRRILHAGLGLCAGLGLWGLACDVPQRTADFEVQQEIPFGPIAVSVLAWETVAERHPPLSSLRTMQGEKAIAVFVTWSGLEPYSEQDRHLFVEAFLRASLRLVDSEQHDYPAVGAMTRETYGFSGSLRLAARDWVVIFHTGMNSGGYTLRLSHPDPGKGAFDVAIVPLG